MTGLMPSTIVPIVLVPSGTTAGKSHEELAVRLVRSRGRWQQDERLSQGWLGEASRGQAKEQRTCTKAQLADAPPPANPLSSHVLLHGCAIGCASAGALSNVLQDLHSRLARRAARALGGCPSEAASPRHGARLSRVPWVEPWQLEPAREPRKRPSWPSKVRGRYQ